MRVAFVLRFPVPAVILALLCCTALEAAAQQPTREPAQLPAQQQDTIPRYRFRVLGVYDDRTGDPISDVKISDMVSGTSSLTTSTGTVSLIFLPDGGSLVSIKKVGYEPRTMPVSISLDDTLPLTLVMQPLAAGPGTRLPTVTTTAAAPYISPALRGFQERERLGATGYFINDTTLRKSEGHSLADVLRPRMPNAIFHDGPLGATYLKSSGRCGTNEAVTVYLDGVLLAGDPGPPPPPGSTRSTKLGPPNLSQFQVSDLSGVEWYPSGPSAPIGFDGACGALLLWTRER